MSTSVVRPLGPTKHVLNQYYQDLGGPTALGLALCLKYNDWISVVKHDIDPLDYLSFEDFRSAYLATKVASKLTGVPGISDDERREAALSKYLGTEEDLVNSDRFLRFVHFPDSKYFCQETSAILNIARGKIAQILGPLSLDSVFLQMRFGPGSSSTVSGSDVSVPNKMKANGVECTNSALPYFEAYLNATSWGNYIASVVTKEEIEIVLVPKNAKTFRVIGKEPDFNVMLQLGIGSVIRSRLMKFGVDLDNGWKSNAELARQGSLNNELATVDFSSASDRISYNLVRELLPDDWFDLVSAARTSNAHIDGSNTSIRLRKFSSMGNGFTFELESMIFYALGSAVNSYLGLSNCSTRIFGDDLIIRSDACETAYRVFGKIGFVVNDSKSYTTGSFRESCGSHWFLGLDVKPIYLKEPLYEKTTKYKFANAIRRLAGRFGYSNINLSRLVASYRATISSISGRLHYIPEGYGDGGLIEKFDVAVPVLGNRLRSLPHGWQGYKVQALLPRSKSITHDSYPALISFLYQKGTRVREDILGYNPIMPLLHGIYPQLFKTFESLARFIDLGECVDRASPTSGILFDSRFSTWFREGYLTVFDWNDPVA